MDRSERYRESSVYKTSTVYNFRKIRDTIPARVILYMLSFSGFVVSFMMRMDINIAMVSMVNYQPTNVSNNNISITTICYSKSNTSSQIFEDNDSKTEKGEFNWSPAIQSTIIGSFYWCYILSQVVGGVLTQYFGTKTVFGGSQFLTAICSLLIPTAAECHYGAIIALRSIQGIASGLTWPAMYAMVGHWIPVVERSRFMSSFQGFSFGIGITYPLAGFLIAHFGWRVVFYTTGSIGLLWCIFWYFFAFDFPASHPRISIQELQYIQGSIGNAATDISEGVSVPWKSILTSCPAWSIGITTFGRIWVHYVFIIAGPMYIKTVLGLSIQANGVLSGAPFICSYFSSVIFCYIADLFVRKKILSLTNVRKIFTATSQVIPGLLVLLIGYLGCNIVLALTVWFIAVTLITSAYAGAMANIVDIAPNFAGPVLAFAQTIHMTASFLSPIAAGLLTQESQTLDAWRKVFGVTTCVACGTYIVYQIFGTADIQPWNYPDQKYPQSVTDDSQPLNDSPAHKATIIIRRSSNHSVDV
ncbi:PREDICTED: vesicular glutamate transporter 3 [Ceratosolen solmsi marchali]|uniref:Vesicular glutamate transporter 3 n=1 Tax=Ceratosolen solmsi marchali TaxID=326594 RepID=A0AAJ7DXG4_9HYME|nr:PREDICTED: vesicular glutamate transporter 3 [Ceratosolen solmsi marchali]